MLKPEDIKVVVEYTEGYQERYTRACLKQLDLRRKREAGIQGPPAESRPGDKTA